MNNKSNALVIDNVAAVNRNSGHVLSGKTFEVSKLLHKAEAVNDAKVKKAPCREVVRTAWMLLTTPFIGLAYVIALPFIGIGMIVRLALEALVVKHPSAGGTIRKAKAIARNTGLFFAAPFIALGYALAFPFVGLYMLARLAMEARAKNRHSAA